MGGVAHGAVHLAYGVWHEVAGQYLSTLVHDANWWHKAGAAINLALTFIPPAKLVTLARLLGRVGVKVGVADLVVKIVDKAGVQVDGLRSQIDQLLRSRFGRVAERAVACASCFAAGTLVATPHGEQAIQTLHVGDRVLAEDPQTGRVEPEAVQAVCQETAETAPVMDGQYAPQ